MIQKKDEKAQPEESAPLVLIVDDSAAIMDVYHFVLVQAGYRVATAPDGGVGLLLAKELRPSIVILDMEMPKVDGLEFLERLPREVSAPLPPVIVNSGSDECEAPALKLGAVTFLKKPFEARILIAAIEMVLGGAALTADLLDRHAESLVKARQETIAARETLLAAVDFSNPDFHERLEALVVWITSFYGYGMASVDVLKAGKVHVVCAHGGQFPKTGTVVAKDLSFSTDVIAAGSSLLLGDTTLQTSFAEHPAARQGYRFYAGVPLRTSKGVIGALSLGDHEPHIFQGDDMTILQHIAFGIARHTEALATGNAVPVFFDPPGLFRRDTLQLLLSIALRRATRDGGAIELAMIQLANDDSRTARTCVDTINQSIEHSGLVISSYAPGVVALLKYGKDSQHVAAGVDAAITACNVSASPLRGVGVVRYEIAGGALVSASELERIADETRARVVSEGSGRIERVILHTEPHPNIPAAPYATGPVGSGQDHSPRLP